MNLVVGSGPAGIACAEALLRAGQPVTLFDAGVVLDAERDAAKASLAASDPASWTSDDLAFLHDAPADPASLPDKRSFGSLYPYDRPPRATPATATGCDLKPSFAVGGLSTVWGGALLPYRDEDMAGWPITAEDLREGYAAAVGLLPFSARDDDLAALFPLYRTPAAALPMSRQAEGLAAALGGHREALRRAGLAFGQARLAVEAGACVRCGLCLHGCPRDLIYSARSTLERQRGRGLIYRPGVLVRSVAESGTGVEVRGIDADGAPFVSVGDRVFLGAGVIATTEIMLRSLGWWDRSMTIKDSQYFLLPAIRARATPGVATERLHGLCQLFLELTDPAISPHTIHMQAYTYSDMIRAMVVAKLGPLRAVLPTAALLGRLFVLQSYLHSDHSGTIDVALRRDAAGERLDLVGRPNAAARPVIAALIRKLTRLSPKTGLLPARPLLQITLPGRGFHSGGTFPMRRDPREGETDRLGRPYGLSRVHLIDSSVFPSIPATTITLSVMANAYRIGAAAAFGAQA